LAVYLVLELFELLSTLIFIDLSEVQTLNLG